jgi:multidrug transporter EmrE-like cation transporter
MPWIQQSAYFFLTLVFSLGGQMMLKTGLTRLMDQQPRSLATFITEHLGRVLLSAWIWGGVVMCGLGLICWLLVLSMFELSRALPILGGMAYIALFILGRMVLREETSWVHLLGIVLIVTGIFCLSIRATQPPVEAAAAPLVP